MNVFGTEKNGYDRLKVDAAIKSYENEIALLKEQNELLNKKIQELNEECDILKERESVIQKTLVDASVVAQKIIDDAKAQTERDTENKRQNIEDIDRHFNEKKAEAEDVRKRVEYILKSQLALIEDKSSQNGE